MIKNTFKTLVIFVNLKDQKVDIIIILQLMRVLTLTLQQLEIRINTIEKTKIWKKNFKKAYLIKENLLIKPDIFQDTRKNLQLK